MISKILIYIISTKIRILRKNLELRSDSLVCWEKLYAIRNEILQNKFFNALLYGSSTRVENYR